MLKATGLVRKMDWLGRVIIPRELRCDLGIKVRDPMEIFVEGERIILKRYEPTCTFCDGTESIKYIKGKSICGECIKAIHKIIK